MLPTPAAPEPLLTPPGALADVRRRARRRRRREGAVAASVAAAAAVAFVLPAAPHGSSRLLPTTGTAEPSAPSSSSAEPSGPATAPSPQPSESTAPEPSATPSDEPPPEEPSATPTSTPSPTPTPTPSSYAEVLQADPYALTCAPQAGYLEGPDGWCVRFADQQHDPRVPTSQTGVTIGVWVCRPNGAGAATFHLDEYPGLRITSADGTLVYTPYWGPYDPYTDSFHIPERSCLFTGIGWDYQDTNRTRVAAGDYRYDFDVPSTAFDQWNAAHDANGTVTAP